MSNDLGIGLNALDFEAIGKLTVTGSILDHEIARATLAIKGGPAAAKKDEELATQMKKTVWDTFGVRLGGFIDAYKIRYGTDDWIDDFEKNMTAALDIRNRVAHGGWKKDDEGNLVCISYPRKKEAVGYLPLTHQKCHNIAKLNMDYARMLSEFVGRLQGS